VKTDENRGFFFRDFHRFSSVFIGLFKIDGPPEVPGGDGAVGAPALAVFFDGLGFGQFAFVVGELEAFLDSQVMDGEDVHAAEFEDEKHFNGPATDALDFSEAGDEGFVIEGGDFVVGGDNARKGFVGEVFDVADFRPGETDGAEGEVFDGEDLFWCWVRDVREEGVESTHDGFGGFAAELLMGDGAEKGVEGSSHFIGDECDRTDGFDDAAQGWIYFGQVGGGFGGGAAEG
jgi:hypothetical protein